MILSTVILILGCVLGYNLEVKYEVKKPIIYYMLGFLVATLVFILRS